MAFPADFEIEFVGGPIDGFIERMSPPLEPFLGVKTVPSNGALAFLSALANLIGGSDRSLRLPFAVYELDRDGTHICYRYRRTHAVTREQLRDGFGLSMILERSPRTTWEQP